MVSKIISAGQTGLGRAAMDTGIGREFPFTYLTKMKGKSFSY